MRCRSCNYALWNLTSRQCPECGTPFRPSEFDFTPGSVRFHCPHCSKAYYGTDQRGHLVPPSFTCIGCNTPIEMDSMSLSPSHGVAEELTTPREHAWISRSRVGAVRGFVRTCIDAMFRPGELGRSLPPTEVALGAYWFLILSQTLFWTLFIGVIALIPLLVSRGVGASSLVGAFGIFIVAVVALSVLVAVPLWALTAHGILRIGGDSRAGLGLTFASICYSGGANAPSAFPFIGYLFGPIWWVVSAVITVKESQRVSGGRAALAVLTFPILAMVLGVGGYIAVIGIALTAATRAATAAQAIAVASTEAASFQSLAALTAGAVNSPVSPGTAATPLDMILSGQIDPQWLISSEGQTTAQAFPVSGVRLSDLPLLTTEEADSLRARRELLPVAAGGQRFGDVVFYTHSVTSTNASPGLWLVVMWPDPGANPVESGSWTIRVGGADGTVSELSPAAFDGLIEAQNSLRTGLGLPAITHPREVK